MSAAPMQPSIEDQAEWIAEEFGALKDSDETRAAHKAAILALVASKGEEPPTLPEKLATLGWQAIECDLCGSGARAFPAAAVDQRARFEQFMRKSRTDKGVKGREKLLQRTEGGDYASDHAQRHWWTWQSALGLTRHSKDTFDAARAALAKATEAT